MAQTGLAPGADRSLEHGVGWDRLQALQVYRFFTDLTGILMHAIKFFGFDWVRLGSIPAWFQKVVTSLFAFFDFGFWIKRSGARGTEAGAEGSPSPFPSIGPTTTTGTGFFII